MIEFQLTKGSICTIDEQDADLLQYKWSELVRTTTYAKSTKSIDGKQRLLHRVIFERMANRKLEPSEVVDHEDNNGLNCTRKNLRLANQSKNRGNSQLNRNNSTGYKGVHLLKATGRYEARIRINYHFYHLGCFDTPEEAYEAYKKAATKEWGEFARFE